MAAPRACRILACLRSTASHCPHRSTKRQCLRTLSSSTSYKQNGKRQLMTESAYRPTSLDPPPPPPRNTGVPNTSIAGSASHHLGSANLKQELSWTGSTLNSPTIKKDTPAVEVTESEAQISKPVAASSLPTTPSTQIPSSSTVTPPRPRRTLHAQKAAMTLTSTAVERLRDLQEEQKLIRVGVKSKGCSGSAYHLEYVEKPARFDEVVEQDGVKVLIDSKALIKVLGSEMDWVEDRLSQRFTFKNPNVTEQCGCGESFSVG